MFRLLEAVRPFVATCQGHPFTLMPQTSSPRFPFLFLHNKVWSAPRHPRPRHRAPLLARLSYAIPSPGAILELPCLQIDNGIGPFVAFSSRHSRTALSLSLSAFSALPLDARPRHSDMSVGQPWTPGPGNVGFSDISLALVGKIMRFPQLVPTV